MDIDLLVGCILEDKDHGETGLVGAYIIEEQFYRFKYGNRFFYSFPNGEYSFTEGIYSQYQNYFKQIIGILL